MTDTLEYLLSTLALTDEQRTALERELLHPAGAATLGMLASDIGHDLANHAFAVLGHVDLLLLDADPGSPVERRLQIVKQTTLELKDELRALLDYARPSEPHESASLDDAARGAAALIRHGDGKALQIEAMYPAGPVLVRCPPAELMQAALHLLAGARAAAGDDGSIDVEVTPDGVLRVWPGAAGGLGVIATRRIAVDNGGSLERDGETLALRLPLWVAS